MNQEWLELARDALSLRLFSAGTTTVTTGGLLGAIVFGLGIWWLARLLEQALLRLGHGHESEPWRYARIHTLSRLLRYAVWVTGTMLGLNYLGIDLTSIALFGGAFAVGLGVGLQNVFSNFVSGVIILIDRSLKVGDFVDLESGVRGVVREIAMRYTRITTNDSLDVLVPNSEFINGRVANWTLDDAFRRMHIPFGVAYGTPKEIVREAGLAAARRVDGVIETDRRRTDVWLKAYGDSSMDYELIVWADRALSTRPDAAHARFMWALDDELRLRGVEIPFPQRDLHVRSGSLEVRLASEAPAREQARADADAQAGGRSR